MKIKTMALDVDERQPWVGRLVTIDGEQSIQDDTYVDYVAPYEGLQGIIQPISPNDDIDFVVLFVDGQIRSFWIYEFEEYLNGE